jgi:hypothetical protein
VVEPGFVFGLKQPLLEIGMLLPLIAVALFVGQQWGLRSGWPGWPVLAGGAFALALAMALWVSLTEAVPLPRVPWPSLLAAALGGLAVVLGRTWGRAVAATVAALLGAGVGLAALPPPAAASATALHWPLATGLWVGSLGVAVAGAALVRPLRWAWARIGVRVLASWVAAASSIVLALALARG